MKTAIAQPEIGQWYTRADKGEEFQVVAYDRRAGTIEIQSYDGDIDEIDEEFWQSLAPELAAPPEDWTGPVDDVEPDDLGYSETDMKPSDWSGPLQPTKVEPVALDETELDTEIEGEEPLAEPFSADAPDADERAR